MVDQPDGSGGGVIPEPGGTDDDLGDDDSGGTRPDIGQTDERSTDTGGGYGY